MEKKNWTQPEVKELNVKNTEYGKAITPHQDAVYVDKDFVYYSFS